jgi:hypothetical protein
VWYLDGGATEHMTDQLDWFNNFKQIFLGRWPVRIADNRCLWMRSVGDMHKRDALWMRVGRSEP